MVVFLGESPLAIPSEIIEAVRERTSLVDVVSESVKLKPSGKNHLGLCPFHREKTPSFNVREEEGTFHCFGCGKHGSVFDFVMETRGLSFPEAVAFLANRIGIKIPERGSWKRSEADSQAKERQKLLRAITAVASSVFSDALWRDERGKEARRYLERRGITEAASRKYMLGFAPAGWDFILEAARKRLEEHPSALLSPALEAEGRLEELLLEAGLVRLKREQNEKSGAKQRRVYDTFRERLMFTISRSDGAPVAFGGRDLSGAEKVPKYINSPESPIYLKRKTLYGLNQALPMMRSERRVYLVEGYFDVISMVQRGFENTVASCGTAIAPDHVSILKRFVDRVTIVFDGDSAGRKAAAGCADLFVNSGIDVTVVMLEEGEDPDTVCRRCDRETVLSRFAEREHRLFDIFVSQQFDALGSDAESASSVVRGKVGEAFASLASRVTNSVEREALTKRAAEQIGISFSALEELVKTKKVSQGAKAPSYGYSKSSYSRGSGANSSSTGRPQSNAPQSAADFESASAPTAELEPPAWLREANEQIGGATAKPAKSRGAVAGDYIPWWRDLLIAGLVRPQIADRLLKVLTGGDLSVPDNVSALLRRAMDLELAEDCSWEDIEALLTEHQLDAKLFKIHFARARYVGGLQFERLLSSVTQDAVRSGLREELLRLKGEEANAADEETLQRLVQEKLARKRAMAMMGRKREDVE